MRCFLAAWPHATTRLALAAVLDDVHQRVEHRRAARVDDLHLTLAFIGELSDDTARAIARAVEATRFEPFEWQIDQLGMFEPAGVVWAGADAESAASRPLLELADDLRLLLVRLRTPYDARALNPHVTLLHGVRHRFKTEHIASIAWPIDSVALYRSTGNRSAARYERVSG